jgi:phosphoribosyl 1,2-cyclic phosphate phosphodiesterase
VSGYVKIRAPEIATGQRRKVPDLLEPALRITVLGSGTSTGVPVVGCDCKVCRSDKPRNKRLRPSVLLEEAGKVVLIDSGTDLRLQLLAAEVRQVDAVLYTHAHADHILGLDDLRPYCFRRSDGIPCYGSARTLAGLRQTFSYVFDGQPSEGGGKPVLELREIPAGPFEAAGLELEAIPLQHGSREVYAYRRGAFAYATDTNYIAAESMDRLRGLEVLILDALRYRPHPTHFSIEEAVAVARDLGAGRTYFTHLSHDVDCDDLAFPLPPGMELAYDGLRFEI